MFLRYWQKHGQGTTCLMIQQCLACIWIMSVLSVARLGKRCQTKATINIVWTT